MLKRVDLTSRTLVAVIEPGSCFAGTLAELAFAADRSYMLVGRFEGDNRPAATLTLSAANFGPCPMVNGLTRLETRFLGTPEAVDAAKAAVGQRARGRGSRSARARHLRPRRHRLGGRDPRLPRGARELLAGCAHRHGGEPALRRAGDDGDRRSSPASPRGRTGSSSARTPSGRKAPFAATAPGRRRRSTWGGCEAASACFEARLRARWMRVGRQISFESTSHSPSLEHAPCAARTTDLRSEQWTA